MDIIVKKFGGTSVENKEKLEIVCKKIIKNVKNKNGVVVVVSAQGDTTDFLLEKAKEYAKNADLKAMDVLLATGEMQTVALLTMMLMSKGYEAIGLNGMQAGIITDSNYSKAKIITIIKDNILNHLKDGKIVIVAGFQGVDKLGNTTTLGRGGSDLTAVAIAASLNAKKCEIYTDVNGVLTGNPKAIRNVKKVKEISYDNMIELAVAGAKIMHNRSISVGKEFDIQVEVKNALNNKQGSVITGKENIIEKYKPKIITSKSNLSKITITGEGFLTEPGYLEKIYKILKEENVIAETLSITEQLLSIVIESSKLEKITNRIHSEIIL